MKYWLSFCSLGFGCFLQAAETILITSPLPRQVIQREGYEPTKAHAHQPGGPHLGVAEVTIKATVKEAKNEQFQYRVVPVISKDAKANWNDLAVRRSGNEVTLVAKINAGGWYRLELQQVNGDGMLAAGSVEPFGVGEVFLIAGQSYAGPHNDGMFKVEDPQERVVKFDFATNKYLTAHDDSPLGGTIWPSTGNNLLPIIQVPIAFVNVSVGATSSTQWQPGKNLFATAAKVGKTVGRFRYVLWQQGESDVIDKTTTEKYVENMLAVQSGLAKEWGFSPTWLLAKSTLHPTVYNDPEGEGRIREGLSLLQQKPGFRPGPDTDILAGENRGGQQSKRHFSAIGQQRAGLMWFASIWAELNRP